VKRIGAALLVLGFPGFAFGAEINLIELAGEGGAAVLGICVAAPCCRWT
jgi:hypothetical protein